MVPELGRVASLNYPVLQSGVQCSRQDDSSIRNFSRCSQFNLFVLFLL